MYLSYTNIETVTTASSSAESMTTNPTNLVHLTTEEFSVTSITFNDSFVNLINDSSSVTNRLHPDDGNLHFKEEVSVITELNPNVVDTKEDTTTFVNIDGEAMTKNFEVDIDLQGFVTESKVGFEEILLNPVGDTTIETNDILEQTTTVKVPQSETAGPLEFQHF